MKQKLFGKQFIVSAIQISHKKKQFVKTNKSKKCIPNLKDLKDYKNNDF